MRQHNQRLYRLALSLVGDPGDAEDVLQESYVRAFLKLSSVNDIASLGAWLARIVRNQAVDHLRARRARRASFTLEADLPGADEEGMTAFDRVPTQAPHGNPELGRTCDEARATLQDAIALLPIPFRTVFMLREVEGMTVTETAHYLDIPVATVKTRDRRARLMLRATLGSDPDGEARHAFEFMGERCNRIVSRVRERLSGL